MIFKAKTTNERNWVYGYYVEFPDGSAAIFSKDRWESYEVDKDTVCRCLDEVDKNGDFVYVGDMINDFRGGVWIEDTEHPDYNKSLFCPPMKQEGDNTRIGIVVEEDGTVKIRNKEMSYSYNLSNAAKLCDMEIIGNIYD